MATTKKQNTKNTKGTKTTTPAVEEAIVETTEVREVEVPKETPRPSKRLEIDRDELIPCRSTRKSLVYVSKRTSEKFEWANYGDIHYITMGEIIAMKSNYPRMINEGWLIIDDEQAVEQLRLTKLYEKLFEIEDMDDFFNKSEREMEQILIGMPRGFKASIATFARERIENGELDSNRKIKLLEDLLEVDLKIFE